jgi:cysteine desulfurase
MKVIYLDNAATTIVDSEILTNYFQLLENNFVNADALYGSAIDIKNLIEKSRESIAKLLNVEREEIIFTSGASEGNNMIIKGLVDKYPKRKHIITSNIEHSSVKEVVEYLRLYHQFEVDEVKVDTEGNLDFEQFKQCLRQDTLLVSIMMVNNEVGTILPIDKIAAYTRQHSQAFLHSDMTQALGKLPVDCHQVDFASFSAHKIGGLKGSGFIYRRKSIKLIPLIHGGQQEFGLRGGTSNFAGHIMLAKTLRKSLEQMKLHGEQVKHLMDVTIDELSKIDGVVINSQQHSPYILNFSLRKIRSQVAITAFDQHGILLSGMSTCSTRKHQESKVLLAMGFDGWRSENCLRISFIYDTTRADVDCFLTVLKELIRQYGK